MNKIYLVALREFKSRVQKRSFLIATIVIPMIFPAIIALLVYVAIQQEKNTSKQVIYYIDESGLFKPDTSRFIFKHFEGPLEDAKAAVVHADAYGMLHIPRLDLFNPKGIELYSNSAPSMAEKESLVSILETQIRDSKMQTLRIDQKILDSLKTDVDVATLPLKGDGQEKFSDTGILFGIGATFGIMMYMFIFIYGAQVMQGVIEEKTSKVVEVIVSSVRPFQMMMGKILGLAAVGLVQFLIWILLITTLTTVVLALFGLNMPQMPDMPQDVNQVGMGAPQSGPLGLIMALSKLPFSFLIFNFLFFFLFGYLIYSALFAAVGSAVDSPAEAQQFMFPVTIPMLIAYMGLFMFILRDPHGTASVWLSIIPFTSPIAMMGRIAFDPPLWQLILSMGLLILGFLFTTWMAGRIYRVGILMHGAKVNYRVLFKWFMMKS